MSCLLEAKPFWGLELGLQSQGTKKLWFGLVLTRLTIKRWSLTPWERRSRLWEQPNQKLHPPCLIAKGNHPSFLEILGCNNFYGHCFGRVYAPIFFLSIHDCYAMATLSYVKSSCVERAIHSGSHCPLFLLLLKILETNCHVALSRHSLLIKGPVLRLNSMVLIMYLESWPMLDVMPNTYNETILTKL